MGSAGLVVVQRTASNSRSGSLTRPDSAAQRLQLQAGRPGAG